MSWAPPPSSGASADAAYPVTLTVDYPERELNRLTSGLRLLWIIPIALVLAAFDPGNLFDSFGEDVSQAGFSTGGALFLPVLLVIVARQKYPRWWFDFNLHLQRFSFRVLAYLALMRDEYPSTDEEQAVHFDMRYPDVPRELNRWLPLVKWLLAIPHYIVLFFLGVGAVFAVIAAWFAILFTGRYPRALFDNVLGVMRWSARVSAYAFLLVTDQYPPFRLDGSQPPPPAPEPEYGPVPWRR